MVFIWLMNMQRAADHFDRPYRRLLEIFELIKDSATLLQNVAEHRLNFRNILRVNTISGIDPFGDFV